MEEKIIRDILKAKRESRRIEFKENFDSDKLKDWCEIIKDIIAMSNSGGGHILFGLKNDGCPSGFSLDKLIRLDPAKIVDKISSYIGEPFSDFELSESKKEENSIVIL